MADLELCFLGELRVLHDGSPQPLPPSKKTRALLAYLALAGRPVRRERLCELLWHIPDDPRGSLRWSLSKLRRLVDDPQRQRIVADRVQVEFDATDIAIDVHALHALSGAALETATVEQLERAVERLQGHFLEGLELSDYFDFHAWCVAERELAARSQSRLLRALVARLDDHPERALRHAGALVAASPYDESARVALVRLLARLGRRAEAEQQCRLAERLLAEAGVRPGAALRQALSSAHEPCLPPPVAVAPPPAAAQEAAAQGELLGRARELSELAAVFDRAASGAGASFVLLQGDPGIGKSRLLQASSERARQLGATVLEGAAFASTAMRPFALWIEATAGLPEGDAAAVFDAATLDNRDRLFGALSDVIARQCQDGPLLLVLDDLHWCDDSSAAALHYIARIHRQRPLVGLLAARADELRDNAALQQALQGLRRDGLLQELSVGPLPEEALRQLIARRSPRADAERLCRQCGGNTLLAIELARAEATGDDHRTLEQLVRERLACLEPDQGDVLRWAAVLSPRISSAALERVTALDSADIIAVLEAAARQGLLRTAGHAFLFSHELLAHAIYHDISPLRRQVMHRRVAELLERDTAMDLGYAADLAHHAARSGDPGLAARAMVAAARLCLRFFANDDAFRLASDGLRWAGQLPEAERICLSLELNDVLLTARPLADWQQAAASYVDLAEQALDHGALSHARLGYHMASYVRWVHGQWAGARDETLQAERVSRGGSELERIAGLAEAARCLAMLERDLSHADAMLMEAQALADRQRLRSAALTSATGMLRYHEGRLDEAAEAFQEARTLYKSAGDRINEFQANEYLVMIDLESGDLDSAHARCSTLTMLGDKLREGSEGPFAHALNALCRHAGAGAAAALGESLDESLEALRAADARYRLAYVLTRAALIDLERGELDGAARRAGEALEHASLLQRSTEMLLAHLVLARCCEQSGDGEGYRAHAAAVADLAQRPVAAWALRRAGAALPTKGEGNG